MTVGLQVKTCSKEFPWALRKNKLTSQQIISRSGHWQIQTRKVVTCWIYSKTAEFLFKNRRVSVQKPRVSVQKPPSFCSKTAEFLFKNHRVFFVIHLFPVRNCKYNLQLSIFHLQPPLPREGLGMGLNFQFSMSKVLPTLFPKLEEYHWGLPLPSEAVAGKCLYIQLLQGISLQASVAL